jgi:transposase
MLRKPLPQQTALEMASLDGLVPKDHLLRKIEAVVDFSFIQDRVAGLYCPDNGRPPLDPTVMFKALFIGYLFGVRSERQLVREIEVNVAYRWFLGLKLTDPVSDASTLSQNRRRRYNDNTTWRRTSSMRLWNRRLPRDRSTARGFDAPEGQRQQEPL